MPSLTDTFSTKSMITGMEAAVVPEQFLNTTFFGRTEFFAGRFCQVDRAKRGGSLRQLLNMASRGASSAVKRSLPIL